MRTFRPSFIIVSSSNVRSSSFPLSSRLFLKGPPLLSDTEYQGGVVAIQKGECSTHKSSNNPTVSTAFNIASELPGGIQAEERLRYSRLHDDFESLVSLELPVRRENILCSRRCYHELVSSQHEQIVFPLLQRRVNPSANEFVMKIKTTSI